MKWKVKEFAELNKVSVRTLHHYDTIGLLKPSIRNDNGYRFYSESDSEKLKKILFLKSCGFSLQDIYNLSIDICYLFALPEDKEYKKAILKKYAFLGPLTLLL